MKTQLEIGSYAQGPLPVNYINPLPVISGGVAAGSIYSSNASITSSPITINFTTPMSTIDFATSSGASNLYINLTGVAASGGGGDFILFGGAAYTYAGNPLNSISILGAGTTGTITILAH